LQVLIERIGEDIAPFSDTIMKFALTVLESKTDAR
jgi:hypothetical protein